MMLKKRSILTYRQNEINKIGNPNWSNLSDGSYRIVILFGYRLGKTSSFLNLVTQKKISIKKMLFVKDPWKPEYQFLINKQRNRSKIFQ